MVLCVFFLFLLNCMFQHDLLFLSVLYACVFYFCICTCSAQLSMHHMEKRSRNTLIIILLLIIITIIIIINLVIGHTEQEERHGEN